MSSNAPDMAAEVAELEALVRAVLGRLERLKVAQPAPAETPAEPSDEAYAKVARRRARRRRG